MFNFVTNAYAAGSASNPSMVAQLLPLILIVVVFYIFLILPQQKQRKKHKGFIESLRRGDKIITSSGLYGTILKTNDKDVTLEIAEGVSVKIMKDNIAGKA